MCPVFRTFMVDLPATDPIAAFVQPGAGLQKLSSSLMVWWREFGGGPQQGPAQCGDSSKVVSPPLPQGTLGVLPLRDSGARNERLTPRARKDAGINCGGLRPPGSYSAERAACLSQGCFERNDRLPGLEETGPQKYGLPGWWKMEAYGEIAKKTPTPYSRCERPQTLAPVVAKS